MLLPTMFRHTDTYMNMLGNRKTQLGDFWICTFCLNSWRGKLFQIFLG